MTYSLHNLRLVIYAAAIATPICLHELKGLLNHQYNLTCFYYFCNETLHSPHIYKASDGTSLALVLALTTVSHSNAQGLNQYMYKFARVSEKYI